MIPTSLAELSQLGPLPALGLTLAQTTPVPTTTNRFRDEIGLQLGSFLPSLIWAVVLLLLGWIIATVAALVVKNLLKRTRLDNRIANQILGQDPSQDVPVEDWISAAVYWVILLFAIIAFLNALNLAVVSQPLNNFLEQIFVYLPRIGGALLLLGVAWAVATLVKVVVARGLSQFRLDDRLAEHTGQEPGQSSPFAVNETLANALYWFIFLLFLPLVLDALGLRGLLLPVETLINRFLLAIPNIITAGLILLLGWLVARIVRGVVTNFLAAVGADRVGTRLGLKSSSQTGVALSNLVGTIAYILVLIPAAIAALNELDIVAISGPAISMLERVLFAIPQILTAGLVLVLFYLVGRFVADLVSDVLSSMGFDNLWHILGIPELSRPAAAEARTTFNEEGLPVTTIETPRQTPSEVLGVIVLVGIVLFGVVTATEILGFTQLTAIVQSLLLVSARVLSGVVVFAIGLYLANLAYRVIYSVNSSQSQMLAQAARIAIIALVGAMALQQMGVATSIVNLAFGLLLGAVAVAFAIAFGLGGREVAGEQLRQWLSAFNRRS
ncbi:mechanosensitive ion channel [Pseudanabaena sp. FACHB-2040]|uniref:mechanosensitive ion channel n=1 Tax=Pseudanabaena sp. FACHB-2040 TaxID=2692859 RepID=UPI00168725CB|nr:mechanosensitive ion channel [Pseudanabaena sp. FACHB-2040]MBD2260138.1 mechanosensitive ion channel [Pseudanabaena sp. FACHB-2040]